MARLYAQANLEYISTQERIRPMIRSYLAFPEGTTCFDPCCADGEALLEICPDQHLFGMELHTGRALQAKRKLKNVKIGPFENSIISHNSFGFIHLNPPYDWVAGGGQRYEEIFLYRATNYLAYKGIMEYLVPTTLFETSRGPDILKFLYSNYRDIKICKYPEPEYGQYRQIVIFGVKKLREKIKITEGWFNQQIASIVTGDIPVLSIQNDPVYNIPNISLGMVRQFDVKYYNAELAANDSKTLEILQGQSKPAIKDSLTAPFLLDKASLALLAVGGYVDGKMPGHYLLGKYENREETSGEVDLETGGEYQVTRKVSSTVFYALCKETGEDGSRTVAIR